jgi:hypothetical protein
MQLALLTIIFQSAGGQNPAKEDSGGLGLLTSDRDAFLLRPPMHILSGVDTTLSKEAVLGAGEGGVNRIGPATTRKSCQWETIRRGGWQTCGKSPP